MKNLSCLIGFHDWLIHKEERDGLTVDCYVIFAYDATCRRCNKVKFDATKVRTEKEKRILSDNPLRNDYYKNLEMWKKANG